MNVLKEKITSFKLIDYLFTGYCFEMLKSGPRVLKIIVSLRINGYSVLDLVICFLS